MANKEQGYIYIFTNPSFREDWVKIGKTKNVSERLRSLDNTSVPLPFEKYATLKTSKYNEAEELGISFILLAGGEPLLRKGVIKAAAEKPNILFPIFTKK